MANPVRRGRSAAVQALALAPMILILAGCAMLSDNERQPPSHVGQWASTDGASFLTLKDDHTGFFTLCGPDMQNEGLRYDFEAKSWPATIPVTWEESASSEPDPAGSIHLYQDWDLRQETGTGFGTVDVSLYWREPALEMGVDLVVTYLKTESETADC